MDGPEGESEPGVPKDTVIRSLRQGLAILELVAGNGTGVTTAEAHEIGRHTGVTFHLPTLAHLCYLAQNETVKPYRRGAKPFGLTTSGCAETQPLPVSASLLAEMAHRTGITPHLAIFDHGEVILISRAEEESAVGLLAPAASCCERSRVYECRALRRRFPGEEHAYRRSTTD
jgi:DNA-binding IclR family transcriptional regulator